MSYTAPNDIQTKADAIIALASTLADSDLSALGDGTVNTALDVLADQLADSDVEVPPTNAGAILELAKYVSQGGGGASFGNYVNIDMGTDEPTDYFGGNAVPVDIIYAGDYPADQTVIPDNVIAQFNDAVIAMVVEGTSLSIPMSNKTVQAVYLRTITGTEEQGGYIIEKTAYTSYEVQTGFGGSKHLMLKLANIPAPYEGNNPSEIYIKYSE